MFDDNYLEKILGEQYDMSNYFENTYTDPVTSILETQVNNSKISNNEIEEKDSVHNDIKLAKKGEQHSSEKKDDTKTKNNNRDTRDKISNKSYKDNEKINKKDQEDISSSKKSINNTSADSNTTTLEINSIENLNKAYPEIYNVLEPIVELVVKNHSDEIINEDLIESLTDKIYLAVDTTNNNDLVQVNAVPVSNNLGRKRNGLLYDLIKILILNNVIGGNKRPGKTPPPPPPHNHHSNRTPIPPRPRTMNVSNLTYNDIPFPEDQ